MRNAPSVVAALLVSILAADVSRARTAAAQPSTPAVLSTGTGLETFVLVTGMLGGVGGFRQLESLLVAANNRVVTIDPYRLSIDSTDVTFAALARRVDAILAELGVTAAHVVGHSHGAGVMLRVAATSPERVADLTFLDAGALAVNRGPVLSGAMRLVPMIMRLPGGRRFVRGRLINGLRRSVGHQEWLTEEKETAYTEPLLGSIGKVIAMAERLAQAQEPDSLGDIVARVRVPLTVLLGDAPHDAGVSTEEISALARLGDRLRIERLAGVGHFPHEEVPNEVARFVLASAANVGTRRLADGGGGIR